ncbi:hypothetical protein [Kitasatospora sp. NPDC094015]
MIRTRLAKTAAVAVVALVAAVLPAAAAAAIDSPSAGTVTVASAEWG